MLLAIRMRTGVFKTEIYAFTVFKGVLPLALNWFRGALTLPILAAVSALVAGNRNSQYFMAVLSIRSVIRLSIDVVGPGFIIHVRLCDRNLFHGVRIIPSEPAVIALVMLVRISRNSMAVHSIHSVRRLSISGLGRHILMLAAVGVAVVQIRGEIGSERKGDSCFIRSIVSGRGVVIRAVVVIVGAVAGRAVPIIIGAVAGFGRRAFILGCAVGGGLIDRLIRRAVASALII